MVAVRSIKNQYVGVNAHLHSHFQVAGGWDGFHANHISDLMRLMSAQLLPMGYVAEIQQSLQIRRFDEPAGRPESDVTIYDVRPQRSAPTKPASASLGLSAVQTIMSIDAELAEYNAVVLYTYDESQHAPGKPVAWVELLSPSNKPGGQDAYTYWKKRHKLLHTGIVFVELDYLHETISTFDRLPAYPSAPDAHPYHIVVVDPRPVIDAGGARDYAFDVDDPIPTVEIPLNGADVLAFDFGQAYAKTHDETLYSVRLVDYRDKPLHFERYSAADQARVLQRMATVMQAVSAGKNLEDGPFPLADGLPPDTHPVYGDLPPQPPRP
jgi:hypothetical protein